MCVEVTQQVGASAKSERTAYAFNSLSSRKHHVLVGTNPYTLIKGASPLQLL